MMKDKTALCVLALIGFFGVWGIRWGLPSSKRVDLFLSPAMRTPEFYARVDQARDEMYSKFGGDIAAYFGRTEKKNRVNTFLTILNSYSSFLLKTHAMDEAATLVMLSRMNPLQNRWYPQSFQYGGAYLIPLGGCLAVAHALHLIRLVPSAVYYFADPNAMARIYTFVRFWSLVGLLVAVTAVLEMGALLLGPSAAPWVALYFGLAPACLAYGKFAKPHTWSAALTLWSINFAIRANRHPSRQEWVWGSSVLMGLGLGMTVTQAVFLPFMLWGIWLKDDRPAPRRILLALAIVGAVFLSTNFYLFAHCRHPG